MFESTSQAPAHCSQCGSTSPEDVRNVGGYTSCCNEPVCSGGFASYRYHYGTVERTEDNRFFDTKVGIVEGHCPADAESKIPTGYEYISRAV